MDLKVGDRIEYLKPNQKLKGVRGTIIEINPRLDSCRWLPDGKTDPNDYWLSGPEELKRIEPEPPQIKKEQDEIDMVWRRAL